MNLLREKQRCRPMGAAAYFGGDSTSETKNLTEVRDMRVVGGQESLNTSAADSTVFNSSTRNTNTTVFTVDHGAVEGGLQVAHAGIDAATRAGDGLRSTLGNMFQGALSFASNESGRSGDAYRGAAQMVGAAYKDAFGQVADAWKDSSAQTAGAYAGVASDLATAFTDSKAPDKSILQVGGLVVVGLAAVMFFAMRKG